MTGICLSSNGHFVYLIDNDKNKIETIKKLKTPFFEPGLEELLVKNKNNILPSTDLYTAIENSEVVFIAVGTPFDGRAIDLSFVKETAKEIGNVLKKCTNHFRVIIVKSTVIPGTTLDLVKPIVLKESGVNSDQVGFCMNPEFLKEGTALEDFSSPDRIVIGVTDKKSEDYMRQVYQAFSQNLIITTNPNTAELIKYTANTFLALCISYANEIANLCEKIPNVDYNDVWRGFITDKRISPEINNIKVYPEIVSYLKAGCGYGGSCFPKDVSALLAFQQNMNLDAKISQAIISTNQHQIIHTFDLGLKNYQKSVNKIAVLGTAFKPDTDDIRESPGIKIIKLALNKNFIVNFHDPIAFENTLQIFKNIKNVLYFKNPLDAIKNAQIIYVITSWKEYKQITDKEFEKNMLSDAILIDSRGIYNDRTKKKWRISIGKNINIE